MSSLMCIGDAVVDIFIQRKYAYPGGNALNVAVYSHLFQGRTATFTGLLGNDQYADHILATLDEVGVDARAVRRADGPSGKAWVSLTEEGDRVFVGSNQGGVQQSLRLRLTEDDLAWAKRCGAVHTSVYSNLDQDLGQLASVAAVSYDFSSAPALDRVAPIAPYINTGFFSADAMTVEEAEIYVHRVLDLGINTVVVTAGAEGSMAVERATGLLRQGIVATTVVDTMGAGDSFIAGFLAAQSQGHPLQACLERGAESGARGCSLPGAFGHPLPTSDIKPENPR